jgi:hypothetical protein
MGYIRAFLTVAAIALTPYALVTQNQIATGWDDLYRAWEKFVTTHSDASLIDVARIARLIRDGSVKEPAQESRALSKIYTQIDTLSRMVAVGRDSALSVAICLRSISDGDLSESLDLTLAGCIKSHPATFLHALAYNKRYVADLRSILCAVNTEAPDFELTRKNIMRSRVYSLERVSKPRLIQIRDTCLVILKTALQE